MATPMRLTSGFTQQAKFQPLGEIGQPDPTFYATAYDDFIFYQPGRYTVTVVGSGTVTQANAAGGVVNIDTSAAATDLTSLQTNGACIGLTAGNKTFFGCRMSLNDITNAAFNVGLIQKTATPFTVTDGLYLNKQSGSSTLNAFAVVGGVVVGALAVPGVLPASGTMFDLAVVYEGRDDFLIYAGVGVLGKVEDQNRKNFGLVGRITGASGMLTTAALCPTVAVLAGTATAKTLALDFFYAGMER